MIRRTSLIGLLALAALIAPAPAWSQPQSQPEPGPSPGPGPAPAHAAQGGRFFFRLVLGALQQSDLVILSNGGLLSASLDPDAPIAIETDSGERRLAARELASLVLDTVFRSAEGASQDQVFLRSGRRLSGRVGNEAFAFTTAAGEALSLPRSRVAAVLFKVELDPNTTDRQRFRALRHTFQGLRSSTVLRGLMRLGFQQFDLLIRPGPQLESAQLQAASFTLDSSLFGRLQFDREDVAALVFGDPDRLILRTGDQLSGVITVAESGSTGFVAARARDGAEVVFEKGELQAIIIRLPPGAFGGHGPGFQGGPGK